jgi:hypothetical protein
VRNSLRITVLLLAAGLVVLAAAGCGGGKKTSAAPKTGATSTVPVSSNPVITAGGTGNFASAKNCLEFAGLAAKIASAMAPATANPASAPDAASRELQALVDAAPADIKGDLQTIASAFSSYLQALQSSGYKFGSKTPPTSAQMAALMNAVKVFSTAKLKNAEQHLTMWEGQNCK